MNPGYTILSPKCGGKMLAGRPPHRQGGKRWGNRHQWKNACSRPSLTGRASYTSTLSPGMSELAGGILPESAVKSAWAHCKEATHLKKGWMLHQDNAQPHVAKEVTAFLQKYNTEVMVHPPYSPYLSPCDFWLFPRLKKALRGQCCSDVPQCHFKGRFPENPPLALGTMATGLQCQRWPLFWKRNSCNLWWLRINQ